MQNHRLTNTIRQTWRHNETSIYWRHRRNTDRWLIFQGQMHGNYDNSFLFLCLFPRFQLTIFNAFSMLLFALSIKMPATHENATTEKTFLVFEVFKGSDAKKLQHLLTSLCVTSLSQSFHRVTMSYRCKNRDVQWVLVVKLLWMIGLIGGKTTFLAFSFNFVVWGFDITRSLFITRYSIFKV